MCAGLDLPLGFGLGIVKAVCLRAREDWGREEVGVGLEAGGVRVQKGQGKVLHEIKKKILEGRS